MYRQLPSTFVLKGIPMKKMVVVYIMTLFLIASIAEAQNTSNEVADLDQIADKFVTEYKTTREKENSEFFGDVTADDESAETIEEYLSTPGNREKKKNKDKKNKKDKKKNKKHKNKPLPPGLQKKIDRGWELPPGWQDKVQKGQVLPPELYEKSEPLPDELVLKLPKLPEDVEVILLENKAVKIMRKTQEILDILDF
jgi:hypothetical protein